MAVSAPPPDRGGPHEHRRPRLDPALAGEARILARQVAGLDREIADLDATIPAELAKLGHRPVDFPPAGIGRTIAGENKMDTLVAIRRKLLTTNYAILKSVRP